MIVVRNYIEIIFSFIFFFERGFFMMCIIVKYLFVEIVIRVKMEVISDMLKRKLKNL